MVLVEHKHEKNVSIESEFNFATVKRVLQPHNMNMQCAKDLNEREWEREKKMSSSTFLFLS